MKLKKQRAFVSPERGENWNTLTARIRPNEAFADAIGQLKGWNLHLFTRIPSGDFLGCDVIFVGPPLVDGAESV